MVNISKGVKIGKENKAVIGDDPLLVTTGRINPRCYGNSQRIRPTSVLQAHSGHPIPMPKAAEEAATASNFMDTPTMAKPALGSGESLRQQRQRRSPLHCFKISRRCRQSPLQWWKHLFRNTQTNALFPRFPNPPNYPRGTLIASTDTGIGTMTTEAPPQDMERNLSHQCRTTLSTMADRPRDFVVAVETNRGVSADTETLTICRL